MPIPHIVKNLSFSMTKGAREMPSRYRDTKTGRLVSKATWKRSTSGRYKRERIIAKPKTETPRLKPSKKPLTAGKPAKKPAKKRARKRPAPRPPEPPSEQMVRITVSAPFFERTGRKRTEYQAKAARTTAFYASEAEAMGAIEELSAATEEARDAYIEVNPATWVLAKDELPNVQEPFFMALDPETVGTIEGPLIE